MTFDWSISHIIRSLTANGTSSDDELPDIPGTKYPWIDAEDHSETIDIDDKGQKQKKSRKSSTERSRESRARQSSQKRKAMREADTQRRAETRANETLDQRNARNEANAQRMATSRGRKKTKVSQKDGLRTSEIVNGTFIVKSLENTGDKIGSMTTVCEHCNALKFERESPGCCCQNGKVSLQAFPSPPQEIQDLWTGDSAEAKLFRKNSRYINNAVCLASLQVNERRFGGYNPSVIFQGKVHQRVGPLLPDQGELPRFAQLYVHDPALETMHRFGNIVLPSSLTTTQTESIKVLVQRIQNVLHEVNPFIKDFKQIVEISDEEIASGKIVITAKKPAGEHDRRYNHQLNLNEVSILTNSQPNDLVLQKRGGGLKMISDLNPKGMPLHFTLLFPHGTHGWDPDTMHEDGKRRVTPREFFVYYLFTRHQENRNYLHSAGNLFQEWVCMSWVTVENQRLYYQEKNQKALRADTYKNVKEACNELQRELHPRIDGVFGDDHQRPTVGRKILSSSFSGSPRWYNAKFQDGMAIVREYHKPDYFITMTCNSQWSEIKDELLQGQTPQDRPDIVARAFKMKKDQLMKDIVSGELFGKVVAHMQVTEFQKRGLPHEHILIILADHDRPTTPAMVDSVVMAELPPDPGHVTGNLGKMQSKKLEEVVISSMVHGPCGKDYPNAPCMENGRCTKNFPKPFIKETIVDPDNFYATYRRRSPDDGGRTVTNSKGRTIDNSWIVPYNPYLSLKYDCHINVECCSSPKAAKYLYKYVTKGHDRAVVTTEIEGQPRDEISDYQDLRSVGSSEATWHLMAYPIAERHPSVQALRVHLKEQQQIVFDAHTEDEALERQRETELTAFFKYNEDARINESNEHLQKYVDMPKTHTYNKSKKIWQLRKQKRGEPVIGRVHTLNPVAGDAYYLRMLLHDNHCIGKVSFEDMLKVPSGKICETFKDVCCELGLLRDDKEWERILDESAATKLCPQLRELFVIILVFCQPSKPRDLFETFWFTWIDDYQMQAERKGITLTEAQLKTMVLHDLDLRLQSYEQQLEQHGLPSLTAEDLADIEHMTSIQPAIIREELDFDMERLNTEVEERVPTFTQEQRNIYNKVMEAVKNESQLLVFIDARGGCGKTYLLNTILAAVRSMEPEGCTALAMATTGIAANLLDLGRTFHSRMKAPLTPAEDSTLGITTQSNLADLIRTSKLLLIDEATMLDKFMLQAMDRTLRDLMDKPQEAFGGKILLLAGDFRQCLPVVPGASRPGIVQHCINQSDLWNKFEILHLTHNMRVHASGNRELQEFDDWTLSVGNGDLQNVEIPSQMLGINIIPNSRDNTQSEGEGMREFCKQIFPDVASNISVPGWLEGRAILASTNKEVQILNEMMIDSMPGSAVKFRSADSLENSEDLLRFNSEYLNTLTPNGFPQHCLLLKPNMPLMLIRNLNPRQGLCNGTKLMFEKALDNKVLQCRMVSSSRTVLIPRITFIPKTGEYPFMWQRRQFPVKVAFSTTINKSQGSIQILINTLISNYIYRTDT